MTNGIITRNRTVQNEAVARLLAASAPGQIVTYAEMGAAADMPPDEIRERYRNVIDAARAICLQRHGIKFECITSRGLRRMTPSEVVVHEPEARRRRIRTQARKGLETITYAAPLDRLAHGERVAAQTSMAFLGAVKVMTSLTALKTIEAVTAAENQQLSAERTMALFARVR